MAMLTKQILKFDGVADAYLEWMLAGGFQGSPPAAKQIGLLTRSPVYETYAVEAANLQARIQALIATNSLTAVDLAMPFGAIQPKQHGWSAVASLQALFSDKQTLATQISKRLDRSVMVGIIDDGCPFGLPFDRPGVSPSYLIAALWDQQAATAAPPAGGPVPPYGRSYGALQLLTSLVAHDFDSRAAYESLGLHSLRRRASHGAAMLDLLVGKVPPASRATWIGEAAPRRSAPSWSRDPQGKIKPVAFVQVPRDAVNDPTGRWLGMYVLDGLDFILDQAIDNQIEHLVVSISWGPQTGPHDGKALLEQAFAQRVAFAKSKQVTLDIVLAAGNSHAARAHGRIDLAMGTEQDPLQWQVMPGNDRLSFLEIWWPEGVDSDLNLRVDAPDGSTISWGLTSAIGPAGCGVWMAPGAAWGLTVVHRDGRYMALLAVGPTKRTKAGVTTGPYGRWQLSMLPSTSVQAGKHFADLYVARSSANMGARRTIKDGYLTDSRYARSPFIVDDAGSTSRVRRGGTLSGIATGAATHVAAGYVASDSKPSRYSSEGGQGSARNPSYALPTDETPVRRGVLASGNRKGTAVRLVGTSTAAPQLARYLVQGTSKTPMHGSPARVGNGLLKMP